MPVGNQSCDASPSVTRDLLGVKYGTLFADTVPRSICFVTCACGGKNESLKVDEGKCQDG